MKLWLNLLEMKKYKLFRNKDKRFVFIGPFIGDKPSGLSIPFDELKKFIAMNSNDVAFIDSNSANYSSKIKMYFTVVFSIIFASKKSHISLHGSLNDFVYISPILMLRKLLVGSSYSLRKFAGSFYLDIKKLGKFKKMLVISALKKSNINFFETKKNLEFFKIYNSETFLFPNTRPRSSHFSHKPSEIFKILYVGRVIKDKGIQELVNACGDQKNITLTIIGVPESDSLEKFISSAKVDVKRINGMKWRSIYQTMSEHHCLVLPSYYPNEGIPGAIIEAFMCGLPIIVSNHNELPALCNRAGFVCQPKDPFSLREGILDVRNNWDEYSRHSSQQSKEYQSNYVFKEFIRLININV